MRIDFVTIFPRMFDAFLAEGVIARGIKQGLIEAHVWDLREFASDKHRSTDDEAYGGGPGMVMLAEPVLKCVEAIRSSEFGVRSSELGAREATNSGPRTPNPEPRIIMTTPQGRTFTQAVAKELAREQHLILLCGRYEGFDERIREALQPDEISIGDFVVSGGELPSMLIADATGRMIEGVVGNTGSVEEDSFYKGLLDYPHYTRPEEIRGMRVPEVLLSGHHEKIRRWRREQALRRTFRLRPDLLESADLDEEAREILGNIENETG
ncbi:MAG TPA: tRNA (guanosine(37)-N1)-methyltransferase TrmD [Thermoanaerobaculia bacterium]|nr:tRNA (guanosine(37)-N1)-methyltransferase TrmD [Thermoanaerobaculia bacterium]